MAKCSPTCQKQTQDLQYALIQSMLPKINHALEVKRLVKFIKQTVSTRGFKNIVIAVSGGIDSATSLTLAVKALGPTHVFPVLLPYKSLSKQGTIDARQVIDILKIPQKQTIIIDIGPVADALFGTLKLRLNSPQNKIRIGNIMARMRMIALYDRAKKNQALVLGTENKSEHYLSYFTRFGDEASDIEPIKHLYKTQVYELARYLSVPEPLLTKAPTAGLWSGQTDEGEFGFTYKTADQILYQLYDKKLTLEQVVQNGFSRRDVAKVTAWVKRNWFKHELPLVYHSK